MNYWNRYIRRIVFSYQFFSIITSKSNLTLLPTQGSTSRITFYVVLCSPKPKPHYTIWNKVYKETIKKKMLWKAFDIYAYMKVYPTNFFIFKGYALGSIDIWHKYCLSYVKKENILEESERERAGHGFRVIEGEECVVNE